jgi:signal transduction histidine kinase/CheY-like chemotaxis protein/HPt (histidine-containing phosphotransfer) domain-containing protein
MQHLEREKVLYEIAMSIGNTLDLTKMSKEVLQTLLKKLSATSAAIVRRKDNEIISFENVLVSIPKRIQNNVTYQEILAKINDHYECGVANQSEKGTYYYLFTLEDFGCLVLIRDEKIEDLILQSLRPIMDKMTTSLHACELHEALQVSLEEAKAADKAKSQFLANMSHEIRTPLNGIVGFLEILKLSDLSAKQHRYIDVINASSQTLLQIINDILDFSKIEAGELNVEYVSFDLRYELDMLFELFLVKASEKQINFISRVDEKLPSAIVSDKVRLKQIMVNLINNAIKFTHVGHVEVSIEVLETDDDQFTWKVSVIDTGVGIAEDKLALILEPFKQSNNSVTREYGGTGLGLSITKELIELLGGTLEVQSSEGKGSLFFFTITSKKGEEVSQEVVESISMENFTNAKILVAEDNPVNQMLMAKVLQGFNVHYELADNGKIAYDKFVVGDYDLILMDHNMPVMDGETALQQILAYEQEHNAPHTPVIALTANALHGDEERYLSMGFDSYLAKPLDMNGLKIVFHRFLADKPFEQGVNISKNSEVLGVTSTIYTKLLMKFIQVGMDEVRTLKECFFAHDTKEFINTAHSLKGAALNLQLFDVAKKAEYLEQAQEFKYDLVDAINEVEVEIEKIATLVKA